MKIKSPFSILITLCFCLTSIPALAQFGPRGPGMAAKAPSFTGPMAKIFGNQPGFSADLEIQSSIGSSDEKTTLPGKLAFADPKSRVEMDLSAGRRGSTLGAADQMKAMGMGQTIIITRPDLKLQYMINPTLKAYVEQPLTDPEATKPKDDFKVETTLITRENVDGHDCEKNKVEITDKEGNKTILNAWNAIDLDKFPVKIEQTQNGSLTTMLFKNIKLTKPDGALFEPPADFIKYNSYQEMFRTETMKKIGNGQGVPGRPVPEPPKKTEQ